MKATDLIRIIFLLFLQLNLIGSSLHATAKPVREDPWNKTIQKLNFLKESPLHRNLKLSETLGMDLLAEYRKEKLDRKKQWTEKLKGLGQKTKKELRSSRNLLFHQIALKKNQAHVFRPIQGFLESQKKSGNAYSQSHMQLGKKILKTVNENPVTHFQAIGKYKNGDHIGFCFARALLVHHLLLENGVDSGDIVKIFALGEMLYKRQLWTFHVAIMVRDKNFGFLVIDPLLKIPISYQEWTEITSTYDVKKSLPSVRFYLTDPRKFLPASGLYSKSEIFQPYLEEFFKDIGDSLHLKP